MRRDQDSRTRVDRSRVSSAPLPLSSSRGSNFDPHAQHARDPCPLRLECSSD
jgi:hypothetical protein